jgi:hypothetical protein
LKQLLYEIQRAEHHGVEGWGLSACIAVGVVDRKENVCFLVN